MKLYFYLIMPVIILLIISGCKTESTTEPDTENTGQGNLTINGFVVDNTSGAPLSNAEVTIYDEGNQVNRVTNNDGEFSASIAVEKSKQISIYTYLKGYYIDTTNINVIGGKDTTISIKLQEKTVGVEVAGYPASIVLISTSAQNIGVKESGSVESALVTFEVQDSSGNPINIDHSVLVEFSLGEAPGGGEFINPEFVKTNANGRVVVSISSGTKAGVVQFVAKINSNGKTILSKPVNIAIHGGHPDQNHFSVATQYLNIPGWNTDGFENSITAIVGDKYANPCKPLTAVYFTTTGGIVEGSALTNNSGEGSVKLISGNPRPVHPVYGAGFAVITASTADENYNKIQDSVLVLFSGYTILTVSTTQFPDISHMGSASIQYSIKDENGNPIAPNNQVTVSILDGESVKLGGDVNFKTMDTQDKNATNFSFRVIDDDYDIPKGRRSVTVSIVVSGPNGYAVASVSGMVD